MFYNNAKTGENAESFQQYPETSRIIPESENANNKIIINHDEIDLLIAILKGYKGIKLDRLTLIIDKDQEYYLMNYRIIILIIMNFLNISI